MLISAGRTASWQGSGWGPRWHWSRSVAGWSWRSPAQSAPGTPGAGQGSSGAPLDPRGPGPSLRPRASPRLQGAPAAVGQPRPRSPRRWCAAHAHLHPGHLETEAGVWGPAQRGGQLGEGRETGWETEAAHGVGVRGTRFPCRGQPWQAWKGGGATLRQEQPLSCRGKGAGAQSWGFVRPRPGRTWWDVIRYR